MRCFYCNVTGRLCVDAVRDTQVAPVLCDLTGESVKEMGGCPKEDGNEKS